MRKLASIVLTLSIVVSVLFVDVSTIYAGNDISLPIIDAGGYHCMVLKNDGTLLTWGNSDCGQLGIRSKDGVVMDNVKDISAGSLHSMALKTDGTLWTWGDNPEGELGNGEISDGNSHPTQIMENVKRIYNGQHHSFAIKNDDSLWTWGNGNCGQLGNGTTSDNPLPSKIMNNVKIASGGSLHSMALKTDGTLWTWGDNRWGQLGDGTTESKTTPSKIMNGVKAISANGGYSMALKNDGTLWTWGDNRKGELGNGTNDISLSPIKIMDDVKTISAGFYHAFAIKNDGTLWGWGHNDKGQLGNNTVVDSSSPIKIMDNVKAVSCGDYHNMALKTDGSLWIWGSNTLRQLGSGMGSGKLTPTKIMALDIRGLSIVGENVIKLDAETVLQATRYDENGNVAPEGGITWSCSDESVAQITPWGNNVTVKGLKGGKATITATHVESGMRATHEFEVVSYVMTLAGGYTVMLDEELEINYAVKQGEEYVHNDLDIKWEIESKDINEAVKIISDKGNAYTRALTIKGINEGECELVAKVDGAELGRTKVEVLGNLADTINDETIIRAKYLVNNSQYKYYKNYNSVHGMFADEMDLTPSIVKYSLDNYLSVFYKSIYKGKAPDEVTATEFYECVLVKLLNDDENVKVFGKVGDVMSDYILKYGKKIAEKGTKIDDTNKKQLKEICKGLCGDGLEDVGFIDTLLISGKSIETYFEEYAKIYQMASCTNEQIKAIKLIKNSTSDKALKTACDNVIKSIEKAQADTAKYAVSSGTTKTAEQLSEYAFEKMVGALEKFSPALAAFDLVKEITSPINNILFQADDIESDTIDLYALIVIENALKDAISSAEKTFNSNPTAEKAENLMAVADFYKNVQLYGCDICDSLLENYGEAKRNQGIAWDTLVIIMKNVVNREVKMSDVFNALFGNVDAETLDNRKTLSDIRKLIDSADFYGSEGTDVAEFIREVKSTTPSEWAKPEIEKAKNYSFLPDYMQNNYQNNITRAEFCTILTWMIEEKTGKGIDQLIEEKGTPIKSPFEDTYYEYADYMCKLGIVNGVSATEFNPLGEITREQAATMLMRTADVLGYDTSYNTSVESGVSSWATEGVGFVTEKGIMNGTGNGFEPQGKYTKEQAIATFVRMYDNLK